MSHDPMEIEDPVADVSATSGRGAAAVADDRVSAAPPKGQDQRTSQCAGVADDRGGSMSSGSSQLPVAPPHA